MLLLSPFYICWSARWLTYVLYMRFHFAGITLVYLGTMHKAQIGGLRTPVVEINVHCSGRPNSFYRRNSFVEGGALPSGYARNLEHCLPLENKKKG